MDAGQAEPVVQLLESVVQVEHSTAQAVPVVSTTAGLVGLGQAEPVVQLLESVVQVEHSTAQAVPGVSTTAGLEGPGCTPAEIDQGKPAGILMFGSC